MIVIKDLYYVLMCCNLGNVNKCKNLIKSSRIRVNNQIIKDISICIPISESTLYPVLKRLEAQKNVTTYSVEHNGRLRRYYKITN